MLIWTVNFLLSNGLRGLLVCNQLLMFKYIIYTAEVTCVINGMKFQLYEKMRTVNYKN